MFSLQVIVKVVAKPFAPALFDTKYVLVLLRVFFLGGKQSHKPRRIWLGTCTKPVKKRFAKDQQPIASVISKVIYLALPKSLWLLKQRPTISQQGFMFMQQYI